MKSNITFHNIIVLAMVKTKDTNHTNEDHNLEKLEFTTNCKEMFLEWAKIKLFNTHC